MSTSATNLNSELSQKTFFFGLKLWVVIGVGVGFFIIFILLVLAICLAARNNRRKSRHAMDNLPTTHIPPVSKEIKEVKVEKQHGHGSTDDFASRDGIVLTIHNKTSETKETSSSSGKVLVNLGSNKTRHGDSHTTHSMHSGSFHHMDRDCSSQSGDDSGSTVSHYRASSSLPITAPSPLMGLPEFSHLGWGHWFTLRDLELATNRFSRDNVLGEGGYGVVYRGHLINGTPVAVKKLLNNL